MTKTIFILNGPNLNKLGQRQPDIYGNTTLEDIKASCQNHADKHDYALIFKQSNHEGELVDLIQNHSCDALIINAAAFTHSSIAIRDALAMLTTPIIELHLSNIYARESFRHQSYISDIATGVICGFGAKGYVLAAHAALALTET